MSTNVPGFKSFFRFLHHSVLVKLATNSIRVGNVIKLKKERKFVWIFELEYIVPRGKQTIKFT